MYMCSYGILDFYVFIARLERELAQYEYIESKRPPSVFWRSKAICIYLVTCRNLPSSECSRCCVMAENRCHRIALLIETCSKDVITPYRKPTPNTNLVAFSNLNSSESLISISYYCPPITASHQLHVNLPIRLAVAHRIFLLLFLLLFLALFLSAIFDCAPVYIFLLQTSNAINSPQTETNMQVFPPSTSTPASPYATFEKPPTHWRGDDGLPVLDYVVHLCTNMGSMGSGPPLSIATM
jgi:hypothetical protein